MTSKTLEKHFKEDLKLYKVTGARFYSSGLDFFTICTELEDIEAIGNTLHITMGSFSFKLKANKYFNYRLINGQILIEGAGSMLELYLSKREPLPPFRYNGGRF